MENLSQIMEDIKSKFDIEVGHSNDTDIDALNSLNLNKSLHNLLSGNWFKETTTFVFNDKYLIHAYEYDEDGLPTEGTIDYTVGFGCLNTIVNDEEFVPLKNAEFLQIAFLERGDYVVIDLKSKDFEVGYLDHEYIWSNPDYRKFYTKITTLEKYLLMIRDDIEVPYL